MRDLHGQLTLFPEPADTETADAVAALVEGLPAKEWMNVPEAAAYMACSRRTVERWIEDGTLLIMNVGRNSDADRLHARIMIRANRPYDADRKNFLTLEELRVRRSNVSG